MSHEPKQKPHRSKQDYGTPWAFIKAVEADFGTIDVDLAARADNAKAPIFVTPEENSLKVPWGTRFAGKLGWLNPEFADLGTWAEKCFAETRGTNNFRVIMLTPASIGANWFAEHVNGKAIVLGVGPRIQFEGAEDPYPKDLMLSLFGFGETGFDVWRWKP